VGYRFQLDAHYDLSHEPYDNDELAARRKVGDAPTISRSGQRWLLSVPLLVGLWLAGWNVFSQGGEDVLILLGIFLMVPWCVTWL